MCELAVVVALVPLTVVGNRPQRARETEPRDLEQLRFAVDLLRETFTFGPKVGLTRSSQWPFGPKVGLTRSSQAPSGPNWA